MKLFKKLADHQFRQFFSTFQQTRQGTLIQKTKYRCDHKNSSFPTKKFEPQKMTIFLQD